jgi:SsrA-binding protein
MVEIKNRKAYFDYFILKEIECGIVLTGTEIKSIRKGSCNLRDTYARIKNNEVFVVNMFISKYEDGNKFNHDERRQRKLLLHKKEIIKLNQEIKEQGLTLVPLKLYIKDNHAKLLIGLCKGKKLYDKRETIKKRDLERSERY